MKVLAISGSLRHGSSNAALLRTAAGVAPEAAFDFFEELGAVPPFNPDLDDEGMAAPAPVASLRARWAAADAVLLCSPEYAHGMPGALKNALDWLVSDGALAGKPVGVVNASPSGGDHAQAQLVEVLTTMSMRVLPAACLRIVFGRSALDDSARPRDPAVAAQLRAVVAALTAARATPDAR